MSGQQTPDEGLQDIVDDIEQNVMEARDRIGTGDQSSEELQRAITRITQGRTGLINHIRRHMPEALEGKWIKELEENKHTNEEPRERDIEAVRASLRSLAVHAQRVRGDIEQLQQGIREIIDSSKNAWKKLGEGESGQPTDQLVSPEPRQEEIFQNPWRRNKTFTRPI